MKNFLRTHWLCFAIGSLLLAGCGSPAPRPAAGPASTPNAVAQLNHQIEKFNAERPAPMGITPIEQRVSRVEYVADKDKVNAFEVNGTLFLFLTRQANGEFLGVRKVPFHELSESGSRMWGEVEATFTLPGGLFQPQINRALSGK